MVSCPLHGNNAIVAGGGNFKGAQIGERLIADEGMRTACGSRLIPSQVMFNLQETSKHTLSNGSNPSPLWDRTTPIQPLYNPYGLSNSYWSLYWDAQQYSYIPA
ncbi:hypothetical protein BHUM_03573c [Candidatus Burkholderia humilis]|nr:hypothetical protein BHUM_03573c [Candidatus Burkholderia humilis]